MSNPIPEGTTCFRNSAQDRLRLPPWRQAEGTILTRERADPLPTGAGPCPVDLSMADGRGVEPQRRKAPGCFQGSVRDRSEYPSVAEGGGLDPHSLGNRTISSRLRCLTASPSGAMMNCYWTTSVILRSERTEIMILHSIVNSHFQEFSSTDNCGVRVSSCRTAPPARAAKCSSRAAAGGRGRGAGGRPRSRRYRRGR